MFAYDDGVAERFPTIRAGILHATVPVNGASSPELLKEYRAEQRSVSESLEPTPIAHRPSIVAWRRAFATFGAEPTRYRSAAEALLRRLAKQGAIPTIGTLVDIGNLVSIRYAMPVAVFDLAAVTGSITVRFARGDERFTDLGSTRSETPDPGEVIFVDGDGVVDARRWCWRQGAESATGPATTEALFVVEGHHEGAERDVASALADLTGLLGRHRPGARIESQVVAPAHPSDRRSATE